MTQQEVSPATGRMVGGEWLADNGSSVSITTSKCRNCARVWFPPRAVCAGCASADLDAVPAGPDGVVYASTVVRIGPGQFAPPYVLAYLDIAGVRVLAHVPGQQAPQPGTPIRLGIGQIGADNNGPIRSYVAIAGGAS